MITREQCLNTALEIVTKDRNLEAGDPSDNFANVAAMWTAYKGVAFNPHDVALMMILFKICRAKTSPHKTDHYIDIAGYAACGGEVSPE